MKSLLLSLVALCAVAGVRADPLPATVDPSRFGAPTFEERWQGFEASEMRRKPARPTRWRTVGGAGDPTKPEYRTGSGSSIYVDPTFTGVRDGKVLDKPLGLDPFRVVPNGYLAIIGSKVPDDLQPILHGRKYMAGLLTTKFSFSQLFGYFEISAKLPVGKGMWPAFWLLPMRGQWPANGELDIFEGLGEENVIHAGLISGAEKLNPTSVLVKLPFKVGGPGSDWHSYGVAWTAEEIVWYVDRKEVRRAKTPSDMKQVPMYLLLNLAIGGSWGGYPDASTVFPAEFQIERVTVWQLPG